MIDRIEQSILYEDRDILVCHKPAGLAVQSARIGVPDLESSLKNYLYAKQEPAEAGKIPYLAVIHRLDQPVEGLLVFAKNPEAAAALSRQNASGTMCKIYRAVTFCRPEQEEGVLEDYLKKDGRANLSRVVAEGTPGAKKARLFYKVLGPVRSAGPEKTEESVSAAVPVGPAPGGAAWEEQERYLLEIRLETGRHHQIRVQMAHAGMPLAGDRKYGADMGKSSLGLCAVELAFRHPGTGRRMDFSIEPQGNAFR